MQLLCEGLQGADIHNDSGTDVAGTGHGGDVVHGGHSRGGALHPASPCTGPAPREDRGAIQEAVGVCLHTYNCGCPGAGGGGCVAVLGIRRPVTSPCRDIV